MKIIKLISLNPIIVNNSHYMFEINQNNNHNFIGILRGGFLPTGKVINSSTQ
jgi:hypothetical protein